MLKKSFFHFLQLLKKGNFSDIYRISSYYFLDKIVRNFLIVLIKIKEKFLPPPHTRNSSLPFLPEVFSLFLPYRFRRSYIISRSVSLLQKL